MVDAAGKVIFPLFGTEFGLGPRPSKELLVKLLMSAPPCPPWFGIVPFTSEPGPEASDEDRAKWHGEMAAERELTWPGWWADQMIRRYNLS